MAVCKSRYESQFIKKRHVITSRRQLQDTLTVVEYTRFSRFFSNSEFPADVSSAVLADAFDL